MEQKKSIIKKYKTYGKLNNYYQIDNVPPGIAKKLATGWPNVDPKSRQNYSPTMKKMIEYVTKYRGKLFGYVIPVESRRKDARISFDGFILHTTEDTAKMLKKRLRPDEFGFERGTTKEAGGFRFWWD